MINKVTFDFENSEHPLFKEARAAYHKVFDNLNKSQKIRIGMIIDMFNASRDAYARFYNKNETDAMRICNAACCAERYMILFRGLQDMIRKDGKPCEDDNIDVILDQTSKYLISCGWCGLPEVNTTDGRIHYKTAIGIRNDMTQFLEAESNLRKQLAISKAEKEKR